MAPGGRGGQTSPRTCAICVDELTNAARIAGCSHSFCHGCISEWARTRKNPSCPLCNHNVQKLVLEDGTELDVDQSGAGAKSADEDVNLDCLDHAYFLTEVNRVLGRARSVEHTVVRDTFGSSYGRRGSAAAEATLSTLGGIIDRLVGYKSMLEAEARFEPSTVLQELYALSDSVSDVQAAHSRGQVAQLSRSLGNSSILGMSPCGPSTLHGSDSDDLLAGDSHDEDEQDGWQYEDELDEYSMYYGDEDEVCGSHKSNKSSKWMQQAGACGAAAVAAGRTGGSGTAAGGSRSTRSNGSVAGGSSRSNRRR